MLTSREADAGRPEQPTTAEANPGGRSAGDPSRGGSGGMGPSGMGQDTRFVWVEGRYVVDLELFRRAYEAA